MLNQTPYYTDAGNFTSLTKKERRESLGHLNNQKSLTKINHANFTVKRKDSTAHLFDCNKPTSIQTNSLEVNSAFQVKSFSALK